MTATTHQLIWAAISSALGIAVMALMHLGAPFNHHEQAAGATVIIIGAIMSSFVLGYFCGSYVPNRVRRLKPKLQHRTPPTISDMFDLETRR